MFSSEVDPFADVLAGVDLEGMSGQDGDGKLGPGTATVTFQGARFSMEEMKKMQAAYMAEVKRLQEEVTDLEEDLEDENMAALHIPSSMLEVFREILGMDKKKYGDQGMENMHKMQASLSGVHLTDATTEVTSNNPQHIIRLQRLEGSCSGLGFAATFEVEETIEVDSEKAEDDPGAEDKEVQETRRAVIRKLDLEVEPQCLAEMMPFLAGVERRCDLQPFLRGYAEYVVWLHHRSRTFTHIKKVHPESVSLPEGPSGTTLQIMCPQQKGIIYTVSWRIQLAGSGKASPNVSLSVKSAKQVDKMDTKKTLQRAPEEFSKMVDAMGVEKALDTFLRAVTVT